MSETDLSYKVGQLDIITTQAVRRGLENEARVEQLEGVIRALMSRIEKLEQAQEPVN